MNMKTLELFDVIRLVLGHAAVAAQYTQSEDWETALIEYARATRQADDGTCVTPCVDLVDLQVRHSTRTGRTQFRVTSKEIKVVAAQRHNDDDWYAYQSPDRLEREERDYNTRSSLFTNGDGCLSQSQRDLFIYFVTRVASGASLQHDAGLLDDWRSFDGPHTLSPLQWVAYQAANGHAPSGHFWDYQRVSPEEYGLVSTVAVWAACIGVYRTGIAEAAARLSVYSEAFRERYELVCATIPAQVRRALTPLLGVDTFSADSMADLAGRLEASYRKGESPLPEGFAWRGGRDDEADLQFAAHILGINLSLAEWWRMTYTTNAALTTSLHTEYDAYDLERLIVHVTLPDGSTDTAYIGCTCRWEDIRYVGDTDTEDDCAAA